MKIILILIFHFLFAFCIDYNFEAKNFFDKKINFNTSKQDILVIFTSYDDCKLTQELKALNKIYLKYKDKQVKFNGFAIHHTQIKDKKFCSINYGVDFNMFDKYNNNLNHLSSFAKRINSNNELSIYSPILIFGQKTIHLTSDTRLLSEAIDIAIKTRQ